MWGKGLSGLGQSDFHLLGLTEEHQNMADQLHLGCLGFTDNGINDSGFQFSVFRGDFNFNQLMVRERIINFSQYPFSQAIGTKQHYRLEAMCQALEMLFLFGC